MHTKWQSLENRFDEKQKVNSAVDFKEVIKEQMEEEMKKNIAEFTEILVENKLVTSQAQIQDCLLYTSPSPRDRQKSRMPSSA